MSLKNTSDKYGSITITIHWLMAIMIIMLIIVGFYMEGMPDGDGKWKIYATHKAVGLIALALALFRWFWTLTNEKPEAISSWSDTEKTIGNTTKWLLMVMILVMPMSGVIMSLAGGHDIGFFGLFTIEAFAEKNETLGKIAHSLHGLGGGVIAVIIGLHILAAFKHHFIKKDATLKRILGK